MTFEERFIKSCLTDILRAINNECITYAEIHYLQTHQKEVMSMFPDEPKLWEWAGIEEN